MDNEEYILVEGKKIRRGRRLRTALVGIGNSLLGTFLLLTKMELQVPIKYLLSTASLPLEIMNLIAQLKNLWDKQKPIWLFFLVVGLSLASMTFLVITDAVKWGGWTTGILATIAASGGIFFTCIMAVNIALNTLGFIRNAVKLYQKPYYRTPLLKLSLVTKATKVFCFAVLGALMIPFSILMVANPVGATIVISVMAGMLLTLLAVKIVKTIRENKTWGKTIQEMQRDPYELLGVDKTILEAKISEEEKNRHSFLRNFKKILHKNKEDQKNTVAGYIQQCYEYALMPAKKDVERLEEILITHQKNLSGDYKDAWSAWWSETMRITGELQTARQQYEIQKQHVQLHPQLAQLQNAYDLLRKPRGRLKYEEAIRSRHTSEIVIQEKQEDRARLIEQALEAHQYFQIYQDESVARHPKSKKPSMVSLLDKEEDKRQSVAGPGQG